MVKTITHVSRVPHLNLLTPKSELRNLNTNRQTKEEGFQKQIIKTKK